MTDETPRWHHRFDNFSRALSLLREGIGLLDERALTPLEQEGVIQRFEYTWELAWKVLKDYLDAQGVVLATVTPAAVIKAANAARIIDDGDTWMRALEVRNRMSRTYSLKSFERTIADVRTHYLAALDGLHRRLLGEMPPRSPDA